jgi:hypothetical protein
VVVRSIAHGYRLSSWSRFSPHAANTSASLISTSKAISCCKWSGSRAAIVRTTPSCRRSKITEVSTELSDTPIDAEEDRARGLTWRADALKRNNGLVRKLGWPRFTHLNLHVFSVNQTISIPARLALYLYSWQCGVVRSMAGNHLLFIYRAAIKRCEKDRHNGVYLSLMIENRINQCHLLLTPGRCGHVRAS